MKGELLVNQSFIPGEVHHVINKYQLRLDVKRFLWPVYYINYAGPLSCILGCNRTPTYISKHLTIGGFYL